VHLGNLLVMALDLRLDGLDSSIAATAANTGIGNRIRAGKPSQYFTQPPGQLSLLPSPGREVSTGQSVMMRIIRVWNSLPPIIVSFESLSSFSKSLRNVNLGIHILNTDRCRFL